MLHLSIASRVVPCEAFAKLVPVKYHSLLVLIHNLISSKLAPLIRATDPPVDLSIQLYAQVICVQMFGRKRRRQHQRGQPGIGYWQTVTGRRTIS